MSLDAFVMSIDMFVMPLDIVLMSSDTLIMSIHILVRSIDSFFTSSDIINTTIDICVHLYIYIYVYFMSIDMFVRSIKNKATWLFSDMAHRVWDLNVGNERDWRRLQDMRHIDKNRKGLKTLEQLG